MNSRSNKRWIAVGLCATLLLMGCIEKTVYYHYEHTPMTGWEREDTLTFGVPPMTQRAVVQRYVGLRTAVNYPYSKISMVVEQTTLPSNRHRRDTVHCTLVDSDGKNLGHGLSMRQQEFPLPDISLNEGDSLSVTIHHIMSRETLTGISDVGLLLQVY